MQRRDESLISKPIMNYFLIQKQPSLLRFGKNAEAVFYFMSSVGDLIIDPISQKTRDNDTQIEKNRIWKAQQ